jgi:hypothetical protein
MRLTHRIASALDVQHVGRVVLSAAMSFRLRWSILTARNARSIGAAAKSSLVLVETSW